MMIEGRPVFLAMTLLLGTSLCAQAQGTYPNGIRNGYGNGTTTAPASTAAAPTGSTSTVPSVNRNSMGTGQSRPEGALGLTPQLQKELGIGRQQ
jgi:hypothetical protein